MTKLPPSIIGNIDFLNEMYDFLNKNQADNRGFFEKDTEQEV